MRYVLLVLMSLALASGASADEPGQCQCRSLTITGSLPAAAIGRLETDEAAFHNLDSSHRPLSRISLAEYGYEEQEVFLRFSKNTTRSWQVEVFVENPETSPGVKPSRVYTPLSFLEDGKSMSNYCGEIRPPVEVPERFGDRLYLCFGGLKQDKSAGPIAATSEIVDACQCFEYAKDVAIRRAIINNVEGELPSILMK